MNSSDSTCLLDPIATNVFKQNLHIFLSDVTILMNDSLTSGVVPDCFKQALIKPLIKKQNLDCNDLKNYRPVSNLMFYRKYKKK